MNEEKKIAEAIMDAMKMHEESYDGKDSPTTIGEYKLDIADCLIATCKANDLSENFWALLNLAMHWSNDLQLWCEDVLADRNILDMMETRDSVDDSECTKIKKG